MADNSTRLPLSRRSGTLITIRLVCPHRKDLVTGLLAGVGATWRCERAGAKLRDAGTKGARAAVRGRPSRSADFGMRR